MLSGLVSVAPVTVNDGLLFHRKFLGMLHADNVFLFYSFFFGVAFLFLTPPFQVPDEPQHIGRSYQISEGKIRPVFGEEHYQAAPEKPAVIYRAMGAWLPVGFPEVYNGLNAEKIKGRPHVKTSAYQITKQLSVRLQPENRVFWVLPGSYSPFSYVPQALAIYVARLLGAGPLVMIYCARAACLTVYILGIFIAVKIARVHRYVLTLCALMPMAMFLGASSSPDAVAIPLAFILFALVVAQQDATQQISAWWILPVAVWLALCKAGGYLPILCSVFAVPMSRFGSYKRYVAFIAIIFGSAAVAAVSWTVTLHCVDHNFFNFHQFANGPSYGADTVPSSRISFILGHPFGFLLLVGKSFVSRMPALASQFVGQLGWLDTKLPTMLTYSYLLVLAAAAIVDSNASGPSIPFRRKAVFAAGVLLNVIFISAVYFITWTSSGSLIKGFQGRYLIPLAPFVPISLYNRRFYSFGDLYKVAFSLVTPVVLTVTLYVLYQRYYG